VKIACDGRALAGPLTGVGTWTTEVMKGLSADGSTRVMLAAPGPLTLPVRLEGAAVEVLAPPPVRIPGTLWLNSLLPGQLAACGCDVFIASLAIVPRRCPVPAVSVVHDLTPRTHPHRHTLANRFCFNAYLEESLERARAVVAVSRATADAVAAAFPRVRPRLTTILNGVDPWFSPPQEGDDGASTRAAFSGGRPYLLFLGTIEPRKGLVDLVAAWETLHELVEDPPDLVIAGARGWGAGPILRRVGSSPRGGRIHLPGYVDRDQALALLRHASLFVLASEAEGFGLPAAEAISCGTPCVLSDIPALREVAAGAAAFSPPGNPRALARALALALEPAKSNELRSRAAERAPQLRWGPAVVAWRELLTELVDIG